MSFNSVEAFVRMEELVFECVPLDSSRALLFRATGKSGRIYFKKEYIRPQHRWEFENELLSLQLVQQAGYSFAPYLFAFDEVRMILILEWIEGITLGEKVSRLGGVIPDNFYEVLRFRSLLADIGRINSDCKVDEHLLWQDDGSVRWVDFGVTEAATVFLDDYRAEYQGLFSGDQKSFDVIREDLRRYPESMIEKYIEKLRTGLTNTDAGID